MKILLAVDGSLVTKRMLSYIAAHNELLGPEHDYTAVTVIPPVPAYAAQMLQRDTLEGYYQEEADKVFRPIRAFMEQQAMKVHLSFLHGHASEMIASMAEGDRFNLIVMGAHGHSALGNVVLGSVATGVLARCKTPVLLIR